MGYHPNGQKNDPILYAKNVQKLMAEKLGLEATEHTYKAFYEEYCKKVGTYVNSNKAKVN